MMLITYYLKKIIRFSIESQTVYENVRFDSIIFEENRTSDFLLELKYASIPGCKNKYGYRIDIPFGEQRPGNQKHMHVYVRGDEIFAINADGTAHDGYHNVKIPNEIAPFISSKGIQLPANNIEEQIAQLFMNNYGIDLKKACAINCTTLESERIDK